MYIIKHEHVFTYNNGNYEISMTYKVRMRSSNISNITLFMQKFETKIKTNRYIKNKTICSVLRVSTTYNISEYKYTHIALNVSYFPRD